MALVHCYGQPATGKTWLRNRLSSYFNIPSFGIDEERTAVAVEAGAWPGDLAEHWAAMRAKVDTCVNAIVETSGASRHEAAFWRGLRVLRILCLADPATRRRRLEQRVADGYPLVLGQSDYVVRMLRIGGRAYWPDTRCVWDSARSNSEANLMLITTKVGPFLGAA